jgi:thioredoxin
MSNAITLTEDNFETEVHDAKLPVLVDYWAPWCGPCRILAPVIEEIANEHTGSLKVAKVNVDEQSHLADRAGVQGIPTVLLYRDGEAVAHSVGARPKDALEHALGLDAPLDYAA